VASQRLKIETDINRESSEKIPDEARKWPDGENAVVMPVSMKREEIWRKPSEI